LNPRRLFSSNPWSIFIAWFVLVSLLYWETLRILIRQALADDDASHILIVPLIVTWLLWNERPQASQRQPFKLRGAFAFAVPAIALAILCIPQTASASGWALAGSIVSFILLLFAAFVSLFGVSLASRYWFPFAFALFAVPFPKPVLDRIVHSLQWGSAAVAAAVFDLSGLPVLRDGLVFRLPSFSIEVAKECSGIRSSIALLILAVLISHFSFTQFWKKVVFVAAGLVMMLVKNGVRIATLTLLAEYVDRNFLFGRLHHEGGVVFFLFGLALLLPLYWFLRRGEPGTKILAASSSTI